MRILIVDDSDIFRETLCAILTSRGFDVVSAADGPEALRRLSSPPDLLVTDLMMPGMSGADLIARARQLRGLRRLPAVIVTGSGVHAAESALCAAGERSFVIEKSASCVDQIEAFARTIAVGDARSGRRDRQAHPRQVAGRRARDSKPSPPLRATGAGRR
jgi:CheY-like chemotaxis protein